MLDLRGKTVNAENGDVRTMHGAAHVQAAGHRNPQFRRKILVREAFVERIHHALDQSGSIGRRGMAVDPSLGVDDIADGVIGAANRIS